MEVKHHKDIGRTNEEYQRKGWRLYTYQVAGMGAGPMAYNVNHYLLFEKGEWNKPTLNFLLFLLKMD